MQIFLKSVPALYQLHRLQTLPRELQSRALRASAANFAHALQVQLDIQGLEHLPQEPCVIAPLHEGLLDVLALLHLPLTMRFAARGELFEWQYIGQVIKALHSIEVTPEQSSRSYRRLLKAANEVFLQHEHLVLFPQGSICGIETAFQAGAFALAKRFNVPILPVVLSGSHRIWDHPFSADLHLKQTVTMQLLEPIRNPDRLTLQRQMKALALATSRRYQPERDGYWDGYVFEIDPDFPEVYEAIKQHRLSKI